MAAWVGGLALFFGVAFFIRYSFEHNLVPPWLRIVMGLVTGLGLIELGARLRERATLTTTHTLCATGTLILYGTTFAGHRLYHLYPESIAFGGMAAITLLALALASRYLAPVIGILGVAGGFFAPFLVYGFSGTPRYFFGYLCFLNLGLLAMALRHRWGVLAVLGAVGTTLSLLLRLVLGLFNSGPIAAPTLWMFTAFLGLYVAATGVARWRSVALPLLSDGTLVLGIAALINVIALQASISSQLFLTHLLLVDLGLMVLLQLDRRLTKGESVLLAIVFGLLALWSARTVTPANLSLALLFYILFAVLHTGLPLLCRRFLPSPGPDRHLIAPVLVLVLMLIPIAQKIGASWLVWGTLLILNLLALVSSAAAGRFFPLLASGALTFVGLGILFGIHPSHEIFQDPMVFGLILLFGTFHLLAGRWLLQKVSPDNPKLALNLPMASAFFPYALLTLLLASKQPLSPSPFFLTALIISVILLAFTRWGGPERLAVAALAGMTVVEWFWFPHFSPEAPIMPLTWYLACYALFSAFPFFFVQPFARSVTPWAVSALSGVLHFFPVYAIVTRSFPALSPVIGLLPAAFAAAPLAGLLHLRKTPGESEARLSQLAWLGGATLFFVTLILPLQFKREWLAIGLALEGAALCWLFTRVPRPALRLTGGTLLGLVFLWFTPKALFLFDQRIGTFWSRYLYPYGVVIAACFAAAYFLYKAKEQKRPFTPGGAAFFGTVLTFLLVNITIAWFFTPDHRPMELFEFSGSLVRNFSYTIVWAVFALALLLVGLRRNLSGARYMSLVLFAATLGKLFVLDIWELQQIYRIAAFIIVAVIAILASFLYQRFLGRENQE